LADAHDPNAESGNADDPATELSDSDNTACHDRLSVRPVWAGERRERGAHSPSAAVTTLPHSTAPPNDC
jgi:hypothetical protein